MILGKIFKVLLISDDFQMIFQSYNQNWNFLGLIDIMTCYIKNLIILLGYIFILIYSVQWSLYYLLKSYEIVQTYIVFIIHQALLCHLL